MAAQPVVPFEIPVSKQMQAAVTVTVTVTGRGRAPLVATLGYSCASFMCFIAGEDAMTLYECLGEAFVFLGGTPEQVLFDNAMSVVVERDPFGVGQHRKNTQLLALPKTHGFTPKGCPSYCT